MRKYLNRWQQSAVGIVMVCVVSLTSYLFKDFIDYRIVALILLLLVSVLAIIFDILPVLLSAFLSALILNLFFIEPLFHYKINSPENVLLFIIYLVVALVNAVLTHRLRKQEAAVRDKEEKETTIRLYNTLLSSLSHELKTPIAAIIGAVDILKDSGDNMTREQRIDLYAEMEIASNRLNNQVENLLNMSRLETGNLKLKKDWTDINELIFIVSRKIPGLLSHHFIFHPDESLPLFKLDSGLIETTLYCLLHNAVRYTPKDSTISIQASLKEKSLQLLISDNGPGIRPEDHEKIFEKFYRSNHTISGGTGLGLSIVKGIIEAHGGTIQINKTQGAAFEIILPAEASYLKNLKNE